MDAHIEIHMGLQDQDGRKFFYNRPFLILIEDIVQSFFWHYFACGQLPLITFVLGVELTPLKRPFNLILEVKITPQKGCQFSNTWKTRPNF